MHDYVLLLIIPRGEPGGVRMGGAVSITLRGDSRGERGGVRIGGDPGKSTAVSSINKLSSLLLPLLVPLLLEVGSGVGRDNVLPLNFRLGETKVGEPIPGDDKFRIGIVPLFVRILVFSCIFVLLLLVLLFVLLLLECI